MNGQPIHPGLQQQGLGGPTGPQQPQGNTNPYVRPNEALVQANQQLTGEAQAKLAQAHAAGAQAGKTQAETNIIQGLGAVGAQAQAQQQAEQDKIQLDQVTSALMQGAHPDALVQQGADPRIVQKGIEYLQQKQQESVQQYNQLQEQQNGLGQVQ